MKKLTRKQYQVLELISAGQNCRQISIYLKCAPRTIECHVAEIKARLGANTIAHAVAIAMRANILPVKMDA